MAPAAFATVNFPGTEQQIRKSKNSICHTPESPYYRRLKGYKVYNSMQDCLLSGGRKLKSEELESDAAATPLPPCDPRQAPTEAEEGA
jgi:hypothetical protein